jgi:hypothetical protein
MPKAATAYQVLFKELPHNILVVVVVVAFTVLAIIMVGLVIQAEKAAADFVPEVDLKLAIMVDLVLAVAELVLSMIMVMLMVPVATE